MTAEDRIAKLEQRLEENEKSNSFRHFLLGLAALLAALAGIAFQV